jgi:DNA-binding response OmpR family regulator
MSHESKHTVLLIEEDVSLRRLMVLGLEYRGMRVIEDVLDKSALYSPGDFSTVEGQQADLLVLDVDGGISSDWSLLAVVASHPYLSTLPVVVLAWEDSLPERISNRNSNISCLTKPFDARMLYATIEQLLAESTAQEVSATPREQEAFLATHGAAPALTIWPLVTAAGLLLACVGLLGSIAITVVGLLVFMAALLTWTLGTNPGHTSIPNVG